jgi:murein DD-endopeptidase MepM/ murein hydrolase activator NlpD
MMKTMYGILSLIALGCISACTNSPPKTIVLQSGQIAVTAQDTIYSLAKAQGVSVRALVETNHLPPPYLLEEGQVLTLPCEPKHAEHHAPVDELEDLSQGSVVLAQDAWKDIPLEGDIADGHAMGQGTSQGMEDDIIIPSSTLPVPGLPEDTTPSLEGSRKSLFASSAKKDSAPALKDTKGDHPLRNPKTPASKKSRSFITPIEGTLEDVNNKQTASFSAHQQEKVLACQDGVVVYAGKCGQFHKDPSLANKSFVFVSHDGVKGGKWSTVYLGVSPTVKKGDKVKQGQVVGACQGDKLLFQLRKDRIPVNPKSHLK